MSFLFWLDDNLYAIFAALFGMVFASFCCVVVERVPRKISLNGRSRCVCGRELKAYENVPVLGWLLQGGRTRCCKSRIPVHYFLAEVAGLVVWASLVKLFGPAIGFTSAALLTALVTWFFTWRNGRVLAAKTV